MKLVVDAIEKAGYRAGEDIVIALDPASTELYEEGSYMLKGEGRTLDSTEIVSITGQIGLPGTRSSRSRTGFLKTIGTTWKSLTDAIGDKVQLVGDDLFVTNTERLRRGIEEGAGNSILVKLNQIGTLTETFDTIDMAHRAGWTSVTSHRSGETDDTFVADLAVATNSGQIKTGAPSRMDRVAKYNQLLRIEEELGAAAVYPGASIFSN